MFVLSNKVTEIKNSLDQILQVYVAHNPVNVIFIS